MYENIRRRCHTTTVRELGKDTVWEINKNIIDLYKDVSTEEILRNKNEYDMELFYTHRCALSDADMRRDLFMQFEFETAGGERDELIPWLEDNLIMGTDALLTYRREGGEDITKTLIEAFGVVVDYMEGSI